MCPSFCPTKTTKHFSPLSCSCTLVPYDDGLADNFSPLLCHENFFFFKKKKYCLFIFFFFNSQSLCAFLYLYPSLKKSPNNHFFDKVSPVLFFFYHLFFSFLLFLGWRLSFFDVLIFFLQGWGKANKGSGRAKLRCLFCDFSRATQEVETWFDAFIYILLKKQQFFLWSCDTTLLIPLVDFYGCHL